MMEGQHWPLGSVKELKEMNLNLTQVGSCSAPEKNGTRGFFNRGCPCYRMDEADSEGNPIVFECEWRDKNVVLDKDDKGEVVGSHLEDAAPGEARPKNVVSRQIKSQRGKSATLREDWMPCYQHLLQKRPLSGRNGVFIKVIGFEGRKCTKRGTKRIDPLVSGGDPIEKVSFWKEPVPVFERPADNEALFNEAYAHEIAAEEKSAAESTMIQQALHQPVVEGVDEVEDVSATIDIDTARKLAKSKR